MSRTLPTGYVALTEANVFRPIILAQLNWPTGTIYVWNGYGSITWDGKTFLGTGHMGKISEIRETQGSQATGVTLTLSGIPTALVVDALANDSQGRPGKIWFGSINKDAAFEADPYCVFDGVIDICPITDSAETCSISVKLEKELIDRRVHSRRRTHEDQQIDAPGDLYFNYVAAIANKSISWGSAHQPASPVPPMSSGAGMAGGGGPTELL
jgi:hypothetical protein